MATGDNPRFNAGMGSVAMYAAAPVDAPYPGINPWSPFTPGVQPVPQSLPAQGLTVATGGPEPIEQILSRVRARIGEIQAEIARVEGLRSELAGLNQMLNAFESWDRTKNDRPAKVSPSESTGGEEK
jgi:hypothetical protein